MEKRKETPQSSSGKTLDFDSSSVRKPIAGSSPAWG